MTSLATFIKSLEFKVLFSKLWPKTFDVLRWNRSEFIKKVIYNYSLKWRWLVVDIYSAMKQRGKYPQLGTDTEVK